MRKNIRHYYLYFFALIFSATLYFSFTTISSNDDVTHMRNADLKAGAAFQVGSIILIIIVAVFVFYANHLFMKRRSREIGLYQLIGMPKSKINSMICIENFILFTSAVSLGVLIGYFFSRFFTMTFLKVIGSDDFVEMYFSTDALVQTLVVFAIIFGFILLQTMWLIARSKLLDLFQAESKSEQQVKKIAPYQLVLGLLGIVLIAFGYYRSSILFEVKNTITLNDLFIAMAIILFSVIIGTFLFFRYSVSFLFNVIRSSKKGHLNITDVVAVTPIIHRIRSSSLSLSLITILTALALGILSLGSIAYYGVHATANQNSSYDFVTFNNQGSFEQQLKKEQIDFKKQTFQIVSANIDTQNLLKEKPTDDALENISNKTQVVAFSDAKRVFPSINITDDEAYLTGYSQMMASIIPLESGRTIQVLLPGLTKNLRVKTIEKQAIVPSYLTSGVPAVVVSDALFKQLQENKKVQKMTAWHSFTGYTVPEQDIKQATELYFKTTNDGTFKSKKQELHPKPKAILIKALQEQMGLVIFIAGFIGLAFLFTSGSILYFKQMSEADEERTSFTTMRKIGFSEQEIMRGIYMKQLFNFGIPLVIGLLHSYFAVKSGWMFFGTELYTPLFMTMGIYILLYSIFALLTTQYYKNVVRQAL